MVDGPFETEPRSGSPDFRENVDPPGIEGFRTLELEESVNPIGTVQDGGGESETIIYNNPDVEDGTYWVYSFGLHFQGGTKTEGVHCWATFEDDEGNVFLRPVFNPEVKQHFAWPDGIPVVPGGQMTLEIRNESGSSVDLYAGASYRRDDK